MVGIWDVTAVWAAPGSDPWLALSGNFAIVNGEAQYLPLFRYDGSDAAATPVVVEGLPSGLFYSFWGRAADDLWAVGRTGAPPRLMRDAQRASPVPGRCEIRQ